MQECRLRALKTSLWKSQHEMNILPTKMRTKSIQSMWKSEACQRGTFLLMFAASFGPMSSFVSAANHTKSSLTFHVSPGGEDQPDRNGSANEVWATLSYACQRVTKAGATIVIHAGDYVDHSPCVLAAGVNIKGDGRKNVTIRSICDDWYLSAVSSPIVDGNHDVSGFTLDGDKKRLAHGIQFKGRHNVRIHDVAIRDVESFGLQIFAADGQSKRTPPKTYLTGIKVFDCELHNCGKLMNQGEWSTTCLSIGQLDGADVRNLTIREDVGTGIAFWENGWFKATRIHDCDITVTGPNPIWDSEIAIELWHLQDDCEVFSNRVNNWMSFVYGDKGNGQHSVRLHDNRIVFDRIDNPKEGIEIGYGLSDVEIRNNYIRNSHYGVALWGDEQGWDISNVSIHHNVFFNPRTDYTFGVFISPSPSETYSNINIRNNVFDGVSEGVQILNSEGGLVRNTIVQNNVFMNTPHGVLAIGGKRIRDTLVTHNLYDGDHVYFESDAPTDNSMVRNNRKGKPDILRTGKRPHPFYTASKRTANIVDGGTDIGLPYAGKSPDVGAFEHTLPDRR